MRRNRLLSQDWDEDRRRHQDDSTSRDNNEPLGDLFQHREPR
jgi:hypothetical protein